MPHFSKAPFINDPSVPGVPVVDSTAGSLDFFSRGHPRAVLVDAEPKVVERMVERSQPPGDVKQFRFRVGRDPGGKMPGVFCLGGRN